MTRDSWGWAVCLTMLWFGACKEARQEPPAPPVASLASAATTTSVATAASAPPSATAPTSVPDARPPPDASATAATDVVALDASIGACRVLRGPIEFSVRAPAVLLPRGDNVEAIFNEDGRPRVVSHAATAPVLGPVPSGREPAAGDKAAASLTVPCAAAGERIFCPDRSGAVHRTTRGANDDQVVASSRPASRIAAATLAGAHVALGYLASRQTSEGWVSEAWLMVDEERPLRMSEDGSGATALALAPRGSELLALMIDARTALTAMHARMVAFGAPVQLGDDAVVFVGGPGDRRSRAALAVPSSGVAWSFLPIARDVGTFGLAIVKLDEPPRVDEPVVWSMYPNGLDPAPIAAASGLATAAPSTWVARVRPEVAAPSSPRVLELGLIAGDGTFLRRDVISTTGNATDVALALDRFGAIWLGWVDGAGSWLERLSCR